MEVSKLFCKSEIIGIIVYQIYPFVCPLKVPKAGRIRELAGLFQQMPIWAAKQAEEHGASGRVENSTKSAPAQVEFNTLAQNATKDFAV